MSGVCRHIQNQLAEAGRGFLASDPRTRAHLESCEACASFLDRLGELDEALEALPAHDAPDALVERVLAMKELEEPVAAPPRHVASRGIWRLSGFAVAAGILFAMLLSLNRIVPMLQSPAREYEVVDFQTSRRYSTREREMRGVESDDEVVAAFVDPNMDPDTLRELDGLAYTTSGGGGSAGALDDPAPPPPPPPPPAEPEAAQSPGVYLRRLEPPRTDELVANSKAKTELEEQEPAKQELRPPSTEALRKDDAAGFALEGRMEDKKQNEAFELTDRFANVGGRDQAAGLSSLAFQDASGYWSNTYVPGDPMLRFLDARLRELGNAGGAQLNAPHDRVQRVSQPFDAPERNALSVYLAADRRAITEPTRLTLQVGLKAMARQASRRPSMNVAVVLDRTGGPDTEHALSAFVRALEDASELGDTIRYVIAGAELDELDVATTRLATLPDALAGAIATVASSEDPNTVLGANLVLLATGRPLGSEIERLEALAHRSAVGGIPVSVVAVGAGTNAAEIQRLVLAGQGSRRLLAQPSDAASIVDAELTAASRVVARAVRLRIRLMPGVQLVDILGSRRLDTIEADRVREAEQSIDQRLARNLGIAADRGEDEEGIQIVIPGFYADDSHVILLDVVANGPGPLADVTARYKDVGSLTNAVARASVSLERGEPGAHEPSALEANVTKNVLAFRLSESLEAAGASLARRDANGAVAALRTARQSLVQSIAERPQLDAPDVRADIDLLEAYLTLLGTGVTGDPTINEYVSASLRFASRLKLTSRVALD